MKRTLRVAFIGLILTLTPREPPRPGPNEIESRTSIRMAIFLR